MDNNQTKNSILPSMNGTFYTDLLSAIKTCPLVYISTSHYYIVEEYIKELIKNQSRTHPILDIDIENIGVVDFQNKWVTRLSELDNLNVASRTAENSQEILLTSIKGRCIPTDDNANEYDNTNIFILKDVSDLLKRKNDKNENINLTYYLHEIADLYERGYYSNQIESESRRSNLMCVIVLDPAPASELPTSLIDLFAVVNFPFPDYIEIKDFVSRIKVSEQYSDTEKEIIQTDLAKNLSGLSYQDIKSIIHRLVHYNNNLTKSSIGYALEEKKKIISKSGLLEVFDTDVDIDDVGGLENLKRDLKRTNILFRNIRKDENTRLPNPKGILIIGMPGCGKSLIAKGVAKLFGVSLLRLDINKLLGQYVGQSEENLRKALRLADAAHPCVLWIDEVEKAFAGANSDNGSSTVVQRLMGQFLTWMQERKTAVYIVATANNSLKPEFMRKGRFDEVYFVDFPNKDEAKEILKNKLSRYKDSAFDFKEVWNDANQHSQTEESEKGLNEILKIICGNEPIKMVVNNHEYKFNVSFSGAEIESLVNNVFTNAYIQFRKDNQDDLQKGQIKITTKHFYDVINGNKREHIEGMKDNIQALQKGIDGKKLPIETIREMQCQYHLKKA